MVFALTPGLKPHLWLVYCTKLDRHSKWEKKRSDCLSFASLVCCFWSLKVPDWDFPKLPQTNFSVPPLARHFQFKSYFYKKKSSRDVFVYSHDSPKTGLSTSNSHSCSAASSKHASDPGVCFYGVCAGLAKPEKCSKGQERFQCQRTDVSESKREIHRERVRPEI